MTKASTKSIANQEIFRGAEEEDGCVKVVFPGRITQDGCCRCVSDLLKLVLYQRQQMPMMYEELVAFQKQQEIPTQEEDLVFCQPVRWLRYHMELQKIKKVLEHLEDLFSLSRVPRVLFILEGFSTFPDELYEINMEHVAIGTGENSLNTSACLRQLFHSLFVADLLSDPQSMRLLTTTVLALGHRNCGVTGLEPKPDFNISSKVKMQVISLASDLSTAGELQSVEHLEEYIWFQVPVCVKGFC